MLFVPNTIAMEAPFAIYETPIGYLHIAHKENLLTLLHIVADAPSDRGVPTAFTDRVYRQVMEYLRCQRQRFDIPIDISSATPFQQRVYEALLQIPYGESRSYKEIAVAIGKPTAARAVGMANNRNPIHLIIPCHRVVGSNGALIGYRAGVEVKDFLLRLEHHLL